jgi:hypothetical protein
MAPQEAGNLCLQRLLCTSISDLKLIARAKSHFSESAEKALCRSDVFRDAHDLAITGATLGIAWDVLDETYGNGEPYDSSTTKRLNST